jgi:hypothetical protein
MDEPRSSVRFEFSDAFEIHDDAEVMARLGLSTLPDRADLERMFPPRFHPYLPAASGSGGQQAQAEPGRE